MLAGYRSAVYHLAWLATEDQDEAETIDPDAGPSPADARHLDALRSVVEVTEDEHAVDPQVEAFVAAARDLLNLAQADLEESEDADARRRGGLPAQSERSALLAAALKLLEPL
jgi:hypothetical protein